MIDISGNPTPYPELNEVLSELVKGIQSLLGDDFTGFYLQGSFAVGDFDEHSDVDYIAAIREELTEKQVTELKQMHLKVFNLPSYWAQHLEGSYFPIDVLRDYRKTDYPLWYQDNGSDTLVLYNHCNSALVRWILREQAVVLYGVNPAVLIDPIPVAELRREMWDVMHTWGNQILSDPERYNNRFYQGFIVLSYCRMLHDYVNGFPGSKKAGAEWAKTQLNPMWRELIDRTWTTRPVPEASIRQTANQEDFAATLRFVEYVLKESWKYINPYISSFYG